jgi:hypothetical protein
VRAAERSGDTALDLTEPEGRWFVMLRRQSEGRRAKRQRAKRQRAKRYEQRAEGKRLKGQSDHGVAFNSQPRDPLAVYCSPFTVLCYCIW